MALASTPGLSCTPWHQHPLWYHRLPGLRIDSWAYVFLLTPQVYDLASASSLPSQSLLYCNVLVLAISLLHHHLYPVTSPSPPWPHLHPTASPGPKVQPPKNSNSHLTVWIGKLVLLEGWGRGGQCANISFMPCSKFADSLLSMLPPPPPQPPTTKGGEGWVSQIFTFYYNLLVPPTCYPWPLPLSSNGPAHRAAAASTCCHLAYQLLTGLPTVHTSYTWGCLPAILGQVFWLPMSLLIDYPPVCLMAIPEPAYTG